MATFLGEIWLRNTPKNKTWWRPAGRQIVHKFHTRLIEARDILEANEKWKEFADNYVSEAKNRPDSAFMKDLVHQSFALPVL